MKNDLTIVAWQHDIGCPISIVLFSTSDVLTKTAPAVATTNADIQITIIQPGGNQMTTMHTINLLLWNLPPEACLGHLLPGLVNNLLSVAALVDTGCKVFFHCTGYKVTFNRAIILRGWRDPKNRLWWVKIVDNGWTTHYKVAIPMQEKPKVKLTTPPTAHAYSLYKCSITHKLMHFYYACLNYPVLSTLIKDIKAGYLRGWPGLTAERLCRHINVSVESKQGHMNQVCHSQQFMQPTPATAPIVLLSDQVDSNMDNSPHELANLHTHHVFTMVHVVTGHVSSNNTGASQ
jgi:hypothetical protein